MISILQHKKDTSVYYQQWHYFIPVSHMCQVTNLSKVDVLYD